MPQTLALSQRRRHGQQHCTRDPIPDVGQTRRGVGCGQGGEPSHNRRVDGTFCQTLALASFESVVTSLKSMSERARVYLLTASLFVAGGCEEVRDHGTALADSRGAEDAKERRRWKRLRTQMVKRQVAARGIDDKRVLTSVSTVPRHRFVPEHLRSESYEDHPLPIGHNQTISQPYIVALMSELARIQPGDKVLEIGTGSGYQAAILAEMGAEVYTIEIVEPLARRAKQTLAQLGYDKVHVRAGDGYKGWPSQAPFDAVMLTAAPPAIPEPLKKQVKVGGRLVAPVGDWHQELRVLTRTKKGFKKQKAIPVRFVPMTGEAQTRGS